MVETPHISIANDLGCLTVVATGMLDLTNAGALRDALKRESESADSITVDLRSTAFVDTAVIQYLASAAIKMRDRDKPMTVMVTDGSHPERVIRTVGFDRIMKIITEPLVRE